MRFATLATRYELLDRGLSVQLLLDGDGTVYQALDLAEVLCARFGIPRVLPAGGDGQVLRALAPSGFSGVGGHYHLSREKPDPGLSLWPGLQAAFTRPRDEQPRRATGA